MGTQKGRREKIEWMSRIIPKIEAKEVDEHAAMKQFCILFASTPRSFRELKELLE